jgi:hypothetical protein
MINLTDENVGNGQRLITGLPDGTIQWVMNASIGINFMVQSDNQGAHGTESYRLLVGPTFQGGARAIGLVWPERVHAAGDPYTYAVVMTQADIDDETNRVQLMFDVFGSLDPIVAATGGSRFIEIQSVAFQVMILGAAMA